jgi:carbon-monoxide dehydrogenase medium subunit
MGRFPIRLALAEREALQNVSYARARSVEEAVSLLAEGGPTARVLAGGTDVIVQARERRRDIGLFVDIKAIEETQQLGYDPASGLTIGAATPCFRIYNDETVQRLYPCLEDATRIIGGVAIQGRASLGGNLCNSSPAADSIPAMIVLKGVATIAGPRGRREVPVESFCTGPGRNVLEAGEFVISINFPPPTPDSGAAWERFIPRNEMDIAVANAATSLSFGNESLVQIRVAIGAVAPTPLLVFDSAVPSSGGTLSPETVEQAVAAAREAAQPIDDMRGSVKQRKHLVGVLVERTLREAARRAGRPL